MPVTMEDTVDFLLKDSASNFKLDQPRMLKKDYKTLNDIRRRSWWMPDYPALTDRQQQMVQDIVSRYLMLLRTRGWPVEDLVQPVWQKPARLSEITHHTIEFDTVNQQIVFQFPYNQTLIRLMRELSDHYRFLGQLTWHPERRCWTAQPTEQTLNLVRYLITNGEWYRDDQITLMLKTQSMVQVPAASYLNGEWQFQHMSVHLQNLCEQVVQNTDSVVTQAFDLMAHGVELGDSVRNLLRTWLKPAELELLMQTSRGIVPAQLLNLTLLIHKVNRWPLVVLDNPYDSGGQVLEHLTWPDHAQVRRYKKPPRDLKERVPWVICASSLYLTETYQQLYRYADRWISVGNVIV